MTAGFSPKLARGGLLLAGAGVAYTFTSYLTSGWFPANYVRNYLGLVLVSVIIAHLLIAFRMRIRRMVNSISGQIEQMTAAGKITSVQLDKNCELSSATDKLNQFLTLTRTQREQMSLELHELKVQSKIAASEKQDIEGILFSISEAVIVTNRFDELVLANGPAEELLGFHFRMNLRRSIDQCISDPTLVRLIRDARRNGIASTRRVFEHVIDVEGKRRTFSVTLSCVFTPDDDINGVVVVLRDVTQDKEVSQMKSDFVSNVSHELKTPLASIMAYVEMLVDGEAGDEHTRQSFYEIIASETSRLNRLIENILNVSRIESGSMRMATHPFSLSVLIRQVQAVAVPQAQFKDILLSEQLAPDHYQIEADEDLVYQAALNLISNAIKYTPRGGTVDVEVSVDEGRGSVVFRVTDNGAGIPPEELPRIFEKFYRVQANNKLAEGTGLGLSLVKYTIETLCNGKLAVTSEVGRGSSFSFELPLVRNEP